MLFYFSDYPRYPGKMETHFRRVSQTCHPTPPQPWQQAPVLSETGISIERRVAGSSTAGAVNSWVDEREREGGGGLHECYPQQAMAPAPDSKPPSHKSHCLTLRRAVRSSWTLLPSPIIQAASINNGSTSGLFSSHPVQSSIVSSRH